MKRATMIPGVGRRAGLGLVALVAGATAIGCATAHGKGPMQFEFTIQYEGACPKAVSLREDQRNCGIFFKSADCVKVFRNDSVVFNASGGSSDRKPFEIFFDPFERPRDQKLPPVQSFKVDPNAPYKAYPFSVAASGCATLDPEVIVER